MDIDLLRHLSPQLRAEDWQVQAVVRDQEVVTILPLSARPLELAVDLGTTKIAGYLVDLESGHTLADQGIMNPQIAYGEDVISRLARAREGSAEAARLQRRWSWMH
jgi:uncharacterized 2Fe-2S/4Fe-4S cluster protein (DUF4445 family)